MTITYDHSKPPYQDSKGVTHGEADWAAKDLLSLVWPELAELVYSGRVEAHDLMHLVDRVRYPPGSSEENDPDYLNRVRQDLTAAREKVDQVPLTDHFGREFTYMQRAAIARGERVTDAAHYGAGAAAPTDPYEGVKFDPVTHAVKRGPKTQAGKEAVHLNALKHGLLSKEAFIVGEDAREFVGLSIALRKAHAPEGAVEDMLVERIITATWRLRRAVRAEKLYLNQKTMTSSGEDNVIAGLRPPKEAPEHLVDDASFERLLRYETTIERSLFRSLIMLQGLQERRTAERTAAARPEGLQVRRQLPASERRSPRGRRAPDVEVRSAEPVPPHDPVDLDPED